MSTKTKKILVQDVYSIRRIISLLAYVIHCGVHKTIKININALN